MEAEAQPFLDRLDKKASISLGDKRLGLSCYECSLGEKSFLTVINGFDSRYENITRVGTQNASLMTWEVIKSIEPDLIINAGTAGGFKEKGAEIGDVYVASSPVLYHDRRIPLGDYEHFGNGHFECCQLDRNVMTKFNIKSGIISSGNSLDMADVDFDKLKTFDATLKDMEAAAIAEVCLLCKTKFMAIKSITDLLGFNENVGKDFVSNFAKATDNLGKALSSLISEDCFLSN